MDPEVHTPLSLTSNIPETDTLPVENGTAKKSAVAPKKSFTRKVIESVVLYTGFIAIGLTFGVNGPTFIDLEILTGGTTDQVAFTFIGGSVSGFFGALCGGAVIHKVNPWLVLAIDFVPFTFFQAALPWSRSIAVLAVLNAVRGFFGVFYDAGGNITLLNIWGKDNGPWMQALHFLFGLGGLIGPLIAKPFIYISEDVDSNNTNLAGNISAHSNQTAMRKEEIDLSEMKVWIAYLITAFVILGVAIALFCVYLAGDRKFRQIRKKEGEKKKGDSQFEEERCFRFTIVGLVTFMAFTYCIVEMNYINFIVVYLVKHLGFSKSKATSMNAAFWAAFTVGRGIGIFVTLILSPQIMLGLCVFGGMAFMSPQPFALMLPEWLVWAMIIGLGLSLSTTFATLITWTERYIKIEGMVGATFMVAGALGDMMGPVTIGILFKRFGPGALMIFLFIVSIVTVCTYTVAQFIAWKHGERERDPEETGGGGGETEEQAETGEMLSMTGRPASEVDVTRT